MEKFGGNKERVYRVALGLIAVAYCVFAAIASGSRGLLLDEVYQLYFSMKMGFVESLTVDPYACPLFTAIAWVWYHIVPYGDLALRSICIVFSAGVLLLGAGCARTLAGRKAGLTAALLLFLNTNLMIEGALCFRPYALYALLAASVLYLYLRRLRALNRGEQVPWRNVVAMGIAMALLGYTHYLGLAFCAIIFLFDIVLLLSGRLTGSRLKAFSSYLIAVVLYIPWVAVALKVFNERIAPAVENAGDAEALSKLDGAVVRTIGDSDGTFTMNDMFGFLGGSDVAAWVFALATVVVVLVVLYCALTRRINFVGGLALLAPVVLAHAMVAPFYFLATQTELITTFWTDRYFMPLTVCIAVACAVAPFVAVRLFTRKAPVQAAAAVLVVAVVAVFNIQQFAADLDNGDAAMYEPFTNYLSAQDDLQDDSTAWLTYSASKNRTRELTVWVEYLFEKDGQQSVDINIIDGCDEEVKKDPDCLLNYEVLYVSMNSNNFRYPTIRKKFKTILKHDYVLVDTYVPYPERHPREWVMKYVRKDVYEKENN